VNAESTLPPPPASKGRDPWKIFGIITIVLVVVGGAVAAGYLLGSSDDDTPVAAETTAPATTTAPPTTTTAAPTTTSPPRVTRPVTTPSPADYDKNDYYVSPLEFDNAMRILTNPRITNWSAQDLVGLDREMMERAGEGLCGLISEAPWDVQGAFDQFKEEAYASADAAGTPRSRADVLREVAVLGGLIMCADLIGLDEL
jgi:hypothetical protein